MADIRKLDSTNLASSNKGCDFVFLPTFDRGGVPKDTVEMV